MRTVEAGAILGTRATLGRRLPSILPVGVPRKTSATVHEVLELAGAELGGLDAEDEGDGVHEIGLACAIGADDGGEVAEGPYSLVSAVRLEVADLDPDEGHGERGGGGVRWAWRMRSKSLPDASNRGGGFGAHFGNTRWLVNVG